MREIPKTEYTKIRKYLLNMILHAEKTSILLPSSRDLAAQFNVARGTVNSAIRGLQEDGYIYSKKGIGNFSKRPNRFGSRLKHIGILVNEGKNLFYEYSGAFIPCLVGLNLTKRNYVYSELHLTGLESEERTEAEFRAQQYDALLYVGKAPSCVPLLHKLADEDFPLVAGMCRIEGIRSYAFAYSVPGYELGRQLAEEKRRELYFYADWDYPELIENMKMAYAEKNLELNITFFSETEDLKAAVQQKVPDAVFITEGIEPELLDFIDEEKIDYHTECRLISFSPDFIDERFCGIHLMPPEKEMTDRITQDIIDQLNGKKIEKTLQKIPLIIENITKQGGK